ncbi:Uncharacterised protein [Chlamydia trachomatis]|nr:Uncharacterised protein [Chlamydia trachomatis]
MGGTGWVDKNRLRVSDIGNQFEELRPLRQSLCHFVSTLRGKGEQHARSTVQGLFRPLISFMTL